LMLEVHEALVDQAAWENYSIVQEQDA